MDLEPTLVHARLLTVALVTIAVAPIRLTVDMIVRGIKSGTGIVTHGGHVVRKMETTIDRPHHHVENPLGGLERTVIEHLTVRTAPVVTELAAEAATVAIADASLPFLEKRSP